MKSNIRYSYSSLLFILVILINACSKERSDISSINGSTVRLKIGQTFSLPDDKSKIAVTGRRITDASQSKEIAYNDQYTLVATLREVGPQASYPKASNNSATVPGTSEQHALKEGTSYYVAIFDASGEYKETKSFKQGSSVQDFTINNGKYTFVVYASGTNAPLSFLNSGTKLNTAKFEQLSADEDLMMDQVSFEVKDGQNELAAQLAHLFTQVTLKLDASAVGEIRIGEGAISPSHPKKSIDISLADRAISYRGAVESVPLVFQNKSGQVISSDSTFIVTPATANGIIKLRDVSVNGSTPKDVVQGGWNLRPGVKYTLEINLKAPADPVIPVAGTNWSIGDLIYRDGIYQFAPPSDESIYYTWSPSPTDQTEAFWYTDFDDSVKGMRMYRVNGSYAQEPLAVANQDPCASVKPLNAWRLPTSAEIVNLMSSNTKIYHAKYDTGNNSYLKTGLFFGVDYQPEKPEMDKYLYFRSFYFISAGMYRFAPTTQSAYLLAGKKYLAFEQPYSDDKRTTLGSYEIKPLTFRPSASAPSEAVRIRCVKNK
ncbi:hypothetical protein [Sphingobacterium ginsenosidimutans]|uniref:Fibrobacter succinogenes major paralogous domain-containing protein n=1 Tax=Sphingobacterium ginsenosidimutans TaxID=687845 RepID=A0ABP7ZVZ6_9SPHI